jgi:hypothetical protein
MLVIGEVWFALLYGKTPSNEIARRRRNIHDAEHDPLDYADQSIFCSGSWLHVQTQDAGLVWHPPAEEPEPERPYTYAASPKRPTRRRRDGHGHDDPHESSSKPPAHLRSPTPCQHAGIWGLGWCSVADGSTAFARCRITQPTAHVSPAEKIGCAQH